MGSCYRPPGQNQEEVEHFMSDLSDSLNLVLQSKPESIFLLGDFNDAAPVWESDHNKSELGLKLYDLINTLDLHQLISEPTHYGDTSANILDLIITDSPGYVTNLHQNTLPPIGSKHLVVFVESKIQYKRDKVYSREIWNYAKGDYVSLLADLESVSWGTGLIAPRFYLVQSLFHL